MELSDSLAAIGAKMDRIIELLEKKLLTVEPTVKKPKENVNTNEWTAKKIGNQIVIKFPYNEDFKGFVKQLGGSWNISKKGWVFPEIFKDNIITQIQTRYPDWTFINNLEEQ